MTTTTPSILISYGGEPVALVNRRHSTLVGPAAGLPAGHPLVRVAVWIALYAQLFIYGQLPGPYTDHNAERFARAALIDPDKLPRLADHDDHSLAAHFRVPVEQIELARDELHPPGGRRR